MDEGAWVKDLYYNEDRESEVSTRVDRASPRPHPKRRWTLNQSLLQMDGDGDGERVGEDVEVEVEVDIIRLREMD